MIKINLASRKQLAIGGGGGGGGAAAGLADLRNKLQGFRFDSSLLREKKVRELILYVVIAVVATVIVDGLKQDEIKEVDNAITKATSDKQNLEREAGKYKTFEAQKKQLEDDERIVSTKLQAVQRLIADRQTPPKFLLALSAEIPPTAWLNDFAFTADEMKLGGYALGYSQISDFMKALGDNIYITDVKLLSTGKGKEQSMLPGVDVASFQLSAKRRASQ